MTRAGLILLLALVGCDAHAPTGDKAEAATPGRDGARAIRAPVADTPTIRFLELVGDMKLDAAERAGLVRMQERERARDAAADRKEDAELTGLLARYAKADAVRKAKMRHALRALLHYDQAKLTDPLPARLLARHDPILVEDRGRRELVTLADIRALDASNRYIARIAGTGAPDMTEKPGERAELQRRYMADDALRTALTHAGPRHAMMVAALDGLPPAKRAEIDRLIRKHVRTPADAADAARGVENAVVVAGQRKAERSRNAAALADFRSFLQRGWRATLFMAEVDGMMRVLDTENRYAPR